jgi:hypothetical protein
MAHVKWRAKGVGLKCWRNCCKKRCFWGLSRIKWLLALLFGAACLIPPPSQALEAREILVLANKNAARSVGLAKYYMKKRGIPEDNLLQLRVTDKESCSREDHEKKVATRVRTHLKDKDPFMFIRVWPLCMASRLRWRHRN